MRGTFAVVLFAVIGAAGCADPSAQIQAEQHGKRLNLVAGEDGSSLVLDSVEGRMPLQADQASALFRDVAGVVLTDPKYKAQELTQWLLTAPGDAIVVRSCPVKAVGGVDFADCHPWSAPAPISVLGLTAPIRSLSSYLFVDPTGSSTLAQVVFSVDGSERRERTCPVSGTAVAWETCSNWLALEERASQLGVPQTTAFADEIVIPYVNGDGEQAFTQQLIAPSGDSVWSRSCSATTGQIPGVGGSCPFAAAQRISAIGIHFDAIQGVGGYTYSDGDTQMYAQTVLAENGRTASRRLCPVTSDGVAFEKCLGWESVDVSSLARHGSAL